MAMGPSDIAKQLAAEMAALQKRVQELERAFILRKDEVIETHRRVVADIAGFVQEQLTWLAPIEKAWQPSDFLPDLTRLNWLEEVNRLRRAAGGLPDEVLVVLVGDTITEEALPAYQTMTNRHTGLSDSTGASDDPWAQWTRGWTAEENRHGELLNKYLYLSGRVDMRAVSLTTQHLIRNGFNPQTSNDPYRGLIYTSFQERATRVSHGNVAQLAQKHGDALLGRMCSIVAGDEARHEEAYKRFVRKLVELDPSGAVMACADMMNKTITMPARLMSDGGPTDLFTQFAAVAQRIGAYTARDYADILDHLIGFWNIRNLTGLRDDAATCQEYLCRLSVRYRSLADRMAEREPAKHSRFSWVFGRSV
jgi:acyl-[acyl-carrier-protein] desaturase